MTSAWLIGSKAISIPIILVTTLIGVWIGLYVFRGRTGRDSLMLHVSICFTSSVFVSAALIHLLPDSLDSLQSSGVNVFGIEGEKARYALLFTIATSGVLIAELIEFYSQMSTKCSEHHHHPPDDCHMNEEPFLAEEDACLPHEHSMIHISAPSLSHERESPHSHIPLEPKGQTGPLVLVTLLSFHSFIAGAALGSSVSAKGVLVVLVPIVAHKWAESLAICYELVAHDVPVLSSWRMLGLYSSMSPLGIAVSWLSTGFLEDNNVSLVIQSVVSSFTSGVFLYTGLSHLEASKVYCGSRPLSWKVLAEVSGLALMLVVSLFV